MIRIFNSNNGDPMLLLTLNGLKEFREKVHHFIESNDSKLLFVAETTGTPSPYDEFLSGIEIKKIEGTSNLILRKDKWLELSASSDEIKKLDTNLSTLNEGDHEHLYNTPISLIIEVDESWPGW